MCICKGKAGREGRLEVGKAGRGRLEGEGLQANFLIVMNCELNKNE